MPKRTEVDPKLKTSDKPVRTSLSVPGKNYYRIYAYTKNYGLSIGDVLEVLLEITSDATLGIKVEQALEQKRREKVHERNERRDLATLIKETSPEQRQLIEKIVQAGTKA